MSSTRLERSTTDKVIAGVCAGLAEYLAVDVTLVRVMFVLFAVFTGGLFVIVYIAMVFLMPLPGRPTGGFAATAGATASDVAETLRNTANDISQGFRGTEEHSAGTGATETVVDPESRAHQAERRRSAFGYLLILVGVVFLLANTGAFRGIQWNLVWPLVVIAIGVLLLVQRVRS
jgi:phage shock protein C